ncbi:sporulation protein SsgA [Nocardioides psychrotolerans]|uniref:Streptomyces sporulation and cell division protein, SsgA n=1 Tax=Nocardioides psychrotolerans TaxID=1005945 RepID=A0A1I3QHE3_9ACTN|nr:SsgA family sporulation/cell division regulator [Nocardioides psychrotolerans]GEP40087.1 sporulation protein SsgA [Nocardioides psychrotolerans]SFJ32949.1 Streptomyces sporulation and cell division protein, SsgA [Nocardioides psychrotolerans]
MAQPPAAPTVSQDITLHCLDDGGQHVAFVASFGYRADDPYAVWLTFHIPGGDVSWAVARSLLLKGLTEPSGDGDIRLWPGLDDEGHAVVVLDFHSPSGSLRTQARTVALRVFLDRTWVVVPPGEEGKQLDLERLVGALLGWSEAE